MTIMMIITEAYSESFQTSRMELFKKIVNPMYAGLFIPLYYTFEFRILESLLTFLLKV